MAAARPDTSAISLAPLLVGVCLLVFGTNLQGVLLPLIGHERGSGMAAIGFFSAGWSAGFVLACLSIGPLLSRLGHVRGFVLLAAVSAGCAMLLPVLPRDPAWIMLRIIIGFCYGGLSAIIEGWLVERAGSGPAFASYMIANLLASLCGTLSLNLLDPLGRIPFVLMAATVGLSMVPVVLSRVPRPPVPLPFRPRLGRLVRASPVAALGCIVVGLITGAIGGLGPLFGMMSGLNMRDDTLMLAANSVGGALAYVPIAMLARRFDRRTLLQGVALLGIAVCVPLIFLSGHLSPAMLILMLGAFGVAQYPLYGLCVGVAHAQLPDQSGSQTVSELLLLFGLGTVAGPIIGGQVMRHGPEHLFSAVAVALALLVMVVTLDRMRGRRVPVEMARAEAAE